MIDLAPNHLETVRSILAEHMPDCEVRAFGSRAKWEGQDYSDLDLAVVCEDEADGRAIERLKQAFKDSDLPIRVDVLDWHHIAEDFRKAIESDCVVVQAAAETANWLETTFGSCASLIQDTISPSDCGETPYIGLEHIGEGTLSLESTSTARTVNSIKSRFRCGDILFGKLRPYFRKVVRPRFDGICSTDIWVVRPLDGVDAGYLFYLMASQQFVDTATRGSQGTRMPRAKWEFVSRSKVFLPPIQEQRAIAGVLGALDDKIELNRCMSETLEEMARAMFRSWFVDFDPVRAKVEGRPSGLPPDLDALFPAEFEESDLGEIPEGWRVCNLDDIADFTNGLALQRFPPDGEDGLPAIKIAEMRHGYTHRTGRASAAIDSRYVVEDGDMLFSWSGSLQVVLWSHGPGALNQHLFKVTSDKFPRWFYWGWTLEHLDDFRSIAAGKATTMGHIQRHHLTNAKVVTPPMEVLRAAGGSLATLIDRHVDNAVQSRELVAQREALLPRLLSGKLRMGGAKRSVTASA